ncbi:MAG: aspartate--tRNA(Asn) ligase [Spirochaetes bacterium]|nr:aspartate--tRNA(Asn) ligase [Spirochaetota bacterium]
MKILKVEEKSIKSNFYPLINPFSEINRNFLPELLNFSYQNIDYIKINDEVNLKGAIHRIRLLPNVCFIILRTDRSLVQLIVEESDFNKLNINNFIEGDFIEVKAKKREAQLKDKSIFPNNFEFLVTEIKLIHRPKEVPPFEINKKELNVKPDTEFDYRPISLRHPKKRAIFKIAEAISNAFGFYLSSLGFTRIHTPKIVFAGAEGGTNIFKLPYFDKEVFLAQSPQFYKQYGVGIFGRVYEIGPVFRAEKHNTSRHLNEYISLDFEMGYIDSFYDVIQIEIGFLKFLYSYYLPTFYKFEINLLDIKLPETDKFLALTIKEIHEIVFNETKKDYRNEPDLSPDEEKYICDWAYKNYQTEFVFATNFPTSKRPFYTMETKDDPSVTESFDLLFRGLEVTTGSQRIHDYDMQVEKLKRFGLNPDDFESYLQIHKYGIPPHGGLAIGLERLTARTIGLENVKEASMYPRDINRVTP